MKETHAAFVALQRAAATLAADAAALLKAHGLSLPQYNILRILRGAGAAPLACGDIAGRLIARGPDMTRLLDRMERDGLVARTRETADRRVVGTRLTPRGRATLRRLDAPMAALHDRQLAHLGARRLRALVALVDAAVRSPASPAAPAALASPAAPAALASPAAPAARPPARPSARPSPRPSPRSGASA